MVLIKIIIEILIKVNNSDNTLLGCIKTTR